MAGLGVAPRQARPDIAQPQPPPFAQLHVRIVGLHLQVHALRRGQGFHAEPVQQRRHGGRGRGVVFVPVDRSRRRRAHEQVAAAVDPVQQCIDLVAAHPRRVDVQQHRVARRAGEQLGLQALATDRALAVGHQALAQGVERVPQHLAAGRFRFLLLDPLMGVQEPGHRGDHRGRAHQREHGALQPSLRPWRHRPHPHCACEASSIASNSVSFGRRPA